MCFSIELTIGTGRSWNIAGDKTGHDLAKDGGVILGLRMARRAFDPETAEALRADAASGRP